MSDKQRKAKANQMTLEVERCSQCPFLLGAYCKHPTAPSSFDQKNAPIKTSGDYTSPAWCPLIIEPITIKRPPFTRRNK